MSATLFKHPHTYCILKVSTKNDCCDWQKWPLWLRRRSVWCSAVQQTIGWLTPPDFHMKYSKNPKSLHFCSPCCVSDGLLDISDYAIQLFCVFFSPPKPTAQDDPAVFLKPVLWGGQGSPFSQIQVPGLSCVQASHVSVKGANYISVCEWGSGRPQTIWSLFYFIFQDSYPSNHPSIHPSLCDTDQDISTTSLTWIPGYDISHASFEFSAAGTRTHLV